MKKNCAVAVFILLSACASHSSPADMATSANDDDSGYNVRGHQSSGMGGNGSIWGEVFRTALQTGMGFVHH